MKIENRQKVLTIVAVSVVALLALDRLILTPLGHVWGKRSERIAELSKDLTQGKLLLMVKHGEQHAARQPVDGGKQSLEICG